MQQQVHLQLQQEIEKNNVQGNNPSTNSYNGIDKEETTETPQENKVIHNDETPEE